MRAFTLRSALAILTVALFALPAPAAWASSEDVIPQAGMLRYPHVSATHIAFVYANDIWLVPREGGLAKPLASPPGQEVNPRFSPDGRTIAFVGNYDGQRDIYTVPVTGGLPHRVTYHPGPKSFTGWTSGDEGGRLIYSSNFQAGIRRAPQLYVIDAEGGPPQRLPVPYGEAGAISPDGKWLAYTPYNRDRATWKRYRGGFASNIWLFNLEDHTSRQMTNWEGTDTQPMWSPDGRRVYYLSDAGDEHRLNIWSYEMSSGRREQVTRFREWDVKWPSMGPGPRGPGGRGEIVFQNGPSIYLLDLATRQSRAVEVRIPGARPLIRTQAVDASNFIQSWNVSPNAKRAVVQARGDVWTLPAEKGSPRNLTRTGGVAERDPSWSPCGQWIAYFSDETGEYELYITQSDARGDTRQLTHDGEVFRYRPQWSPDSKHIVFTDKTSSIYITDVESGETRFIDKDPWGRGGGRSGGSLSVSFSHDSRWIAYAKTRDQRATSAVWVYDIENDEHHQLTSGAFNDVSPVFDRKGDWLFYSTNRSFSAPIYSDLDTTWVYTGSQVLVAAPLRDDVKSPWLPESDEETWKKEDDEKEDDEENGKEDDDEADEETPEPRPDDGVSGTWEGTADTPEMGPLRITLTLTLSDDNTVTGTLVTDFFSGPLSGRYDPVGRTLNLTGQAGGMSVTFDMKIDGETMTGTAGANGQFVDLTLQRTSRPGAEGDDAADDVKPREEVTIDVDGFEQRAIMLPIQAGRFGRLAVNDKNHLLFARLETPGSAATAGIKLFDLTDDKKQEQSVAAGANQYEITPDGKKLLVIHGSSASIQNAAAGASGTNVPTAGMTAHINPRDEWRQLFTDAWRIQRDFFYVDNLHGIDWPAVREHYEKMLDDAASREDVSFIIAEMISELNVGHAYYWGGDGENEPRVSVGTLGADFELDRDAEGGPVYRIAEIHQGGAWDIDARGPLSQPGVSVNVGDYLLEVNGVPVDPNRDPYAAFQGLAGRTITITVSEHPFFDDEARDIVVQAAGDDGDLRYRSWIERNRAYVDEKTDGRVGYIYVPNTGVQGQSELMRQFFAQADKDALIIDERWNGGGQIPTRFIEMLNRPVTNYWARRDNQDWKWPPDAHHGPKVMLINGPAGSGGDMFPWLFRHNNLGKLVGARTWGGLVGISGNPALIDGGYTAVPTFGFYTADGQWSIEGHGVDPCIEVIADPALMVDGGDPQLDAAIDLMLEELEHNAYSPPQRPAPPDRRGWGIDPAHH